MIDWLLGTLVATTVLVVLVLLIREPVRRHFGARAPQRLHHFQFGVTDLEVHRQTFRLQL